MSNPIYLVMPQWQGSPSSRAMRLVEGADALREDLPRSSTREVAVPLEAGDAMGTPIARLGSLLRARDAAREVLSATNGPAIIAGGDCASSLPGIEFATARANAAGGSLAVIWFDAHPALQHPSTSPSGAAAGMALRHALGDGAADLRSETPINAERLLLVGTRSSDPEEQAEITRLDLTLLAADPQAEPADFAQQLHDLLVASGADQVYVHIDLDVIDPAEFTAVHAPVPFGLTVAQLTAAIRVAVSTLPLAGAAICEFAPVDAAAAADDIPTVLRILAALTSGSHA